MRSGRWRAEQGEVVLVLLGPADEDRAVAVQPGVGGLDDPASSPPAGSAYLLGYLLPACADVRRVAVLDCQIVHRRRVIATIKAKPLRAMFRRLGTLDWDA